MRLRSVKLFCRSIRWSCSKRGESETETRYDCWGQSVVYVEYLDKQFEFSAVNIEYLDDGHT